MEECKYEEMEMKITRYITENIEIVLLLLKMMMMMTLQKKI